ncbi:UDP-N-acetylmuramoyl-L-alanine--D-glutamate ligase [Rhodocytophaga aerolata]|uniref:UDP-N-acetylmuramoylalanine--D-glutamate ligase n=1 Tax=Rhodocytophaga aerolata TaxID=455078 RepID=A0ABT8R4V1_9BACT|nr:UDP-N-acetylmuramoyl-L-alanine--D-glutamate ligase [Rhodocytophaga aerolata]MDO1445797.1 UDP-N-acetylmuramoyl-L-alanine--D-glutamate ligase [Rhodocytophaga aerolata]
MKLVILGGGESGVGAALLAKAKGMDVFLSDKSQLAEKYKQTLVTNNILFEEGQHSEAQILDADEVVKSPGIPDKAPLIQALKQKGTSIISEIEFAARYTKARLIGITGSNGKTTTTLLTYHLLKSAGLKVGLAGNIGESFAKQVIADAFDYYVLEISSFQLDNSYSFHPHIAMLLNITPDHLDRYEYKFQNYIDSKFRIAQSQTKADYLIYYNENPPIQEELAKRNLPVALLPISLEKEMARGAYAAGNNLVIQANSKLVLAQEELPIQGKHNAINSMAAILTCQLLNIPEDAIKAGLKTFKNAPHRLEKAGELRGITFINDSKATNVDSVFYALESMKRPVVLIAGGIDKGNDYTQIEEMVMQKVKALVCLGKDNSKLIAFFKDKVPMIQETEYIRDAVSLGLELADPGDVVLLSPACASFDLFKNYEDRGNQFKQAVEELVTKNS